MISQTQKFIDEKIKSLGSAKIEEPGARDRAPAGENIVKPKPCLICPVCYSSLRLFHAPNDKIVNYRACLRCKASGPEEFWKSICKQRENLDLLIKENLESFTKKTV